jgi:predicted nucleotidyltransferase
MPTRSSSSSVLVWPDRETVDRAARDWARETAQANPEVLRIGYMGSYARGDWGVGSDLDLVIILKRSDTAWELRAAEWDTTALPVPADLLVYTEAEWNALDPRSRFASTLRQEVEWL